MHNAYTDAIIIILKYSRNKRSDKLFLFSNINKRNYNIFSMTDLFLIYILQVHFR